MIIKCWIINQVSSNNLQTWQRASKAFCQATSINQGGIQIIRREEKSCYDCRYCISLSEKQDYNRGETESVVYECVSNDVEYGFLENHNFNYSRMAKDCPYFERRLYEKECEVCGKSFYLKQPGWPHWDKVSDEKNILTCSTWCIDELKSNILEVPF